MYSGTTFRDSSGNFLGAHQKIDRIARTTIENVLPDTSFPTIRDILHFEGKNGPDGIKRKSPAKDEPWHYYDPMDSGDTTLLEMIQEHHDNLVKALRKHSNEKAAFEAAWLAHAVVDGLTPAHHFPLHEVLEQMRGEGLETRTSIRDKLIIRQEGDTGRQMLSKNWKYWGAKGVMTTHGLFEWGFAVTIAPLKLRKGRPSGNDLVRVRNEGLIELYKEAAQHVYSLKMYERFQKHGWTRELAKETREDLAPLITRLVILAWYSAAYKAYGGKK
jgi:hypothetical protein